MYVLCPTGGALLFDNDVFTTTPGPPGTETMLNCTFRQNAVKSAVALGGAVCRRDVALATSLCPHERRRPLTSLLCLAVTDPMFMYISETLFESNFLDSLDDSLPQFAL